MEFLKANYHAHTWRCQHAYDTEREYIEAWELKFLDFPIMCRAPIRTDMYPISG